MKSFFKKYWKLTFGVVLFCAVLTAVIVFLSGSSLGVCILGIAAFLFVLNLLIIA